MLQCVHTTDEEQTAVRMEESADPEVKLLELLDQLDRQLADRDVHKQRRESRGGLLCAEKLLADGRVRAIRTDEEARAGSTAIGECCCNTRPRCGIQADQAFSVLRALVNQMTTGAVEEKY